MYSLFAKLNARPNNALWDLISGLLYQFHSQGIEEGEEPPPEGERALVEANEFELAIEPGVLDPPQEFKAYFVNRTDAERAERALTGLIQNLNPVFLIEEVEEKDYSEIWKENFKPIPIPPFFLVRAPWHPPSTDRNMQDLIIEPGMAFGTGSHETTRLCLEALGVVLQGDTSIDRALDFGCGSGILSIALKKLGVKHVLACDIDPLALDATKKNATDNSVAVETFIQLTAQAEAKPFDLIVANILKNTLIEFSSYFKKLLKKNGYVLLSGILTDQTQTVREHYEKSGFRLEKQVFLGEWSLLILRKK